MLMLNTGECHSVLSQCNGFTILFLPAPSVPVELAGHMCLTVGFLHTHTHQAYHPQVSRRHHQMVRKHGEFFTAESQCCAFYQAASLPTSFLSSFPGCRRSKWALTPSSSVMFSRDLLKIFPRDQGTSV